MPANPLTDPKWAEETTDRIVSFIDAVRSQTTARIVFAARALVFGLIGAFLGLTILVIALVGLMRGVQSLLELATTWERAVYLSYFIVGGSFSLVGLLLFRQRNAAAS